MTKARTNASASPAVGRNMIINGAMNVAQRGTSFTGIGASSGYSGPIDRFRLSAGSTAGRLTASQTADGPNGISANCLKLDCTTADTNIAAGEKLIIEQRFEGQNLQRIGKGVAGAKQVTVSFYAKANASFTFACELFDFDNQRQISKLFSVTSDWSRIELTFPADVDDGSSPLADDAAPAMSLFLHLHAGATFTGGTLNTATFANNTNANRAVGIDSFYSNTANNFFLTGVQMEVGPVATEFEQEDIGVTLAKAQRYCQRYPAKDQADDGAYSIFGVGFNNATTTSRFMMPSLPVTMRLEPTATVSGSFRVLYAGSAINVSSGPTIADAGCNVSAIELGATVGSTSLTVGQGVMLQANNDVDANVLLDAEL